MPVSRQAFLDAYQKQMDGGTAALFVGAGMSAPAGFVCWEDLLNDVAAELGLGSAKGHNLVLLAQFQVNAKGGRDAVNRLILDEFTKNTTCTANHALIAQLPIQTVWTTNYDQLLEEAYKLVHKRVDRKVIQSDLALSLPRRDLILYKMHGDVSSPKDAVLTRDDYERYNDTDHRHLFSLQLQGDLVSKTFLFLGFGFADPNIDFILGRVRSLIRENRRDHYWITKNVTASGATQEEVSLQAHRIEDLKAYGIQTVFVDDYAQITELLEELGKRANRKNVFFSGSAEDYSPFGREAALELLRRLGAKVITSGFNVICGMGKGVGQALALGAIEAVYHDGSAHLDDRTILRPFPYHIDDSEERKALWHRYRAEMIKRSRIALFVFGNKDIGGTVRESDGVIAEFEMAKGQGLVPLPVGATGFAAKRIWDEVTHNPAAFYGDKSTVMKPLLDTLGSAGTSADELIEATGMALKVLVPR